MNIQDRIHEYLCRANGKILIITDRTTELISSGFCGCELDDLISDAWEIFMSISVLVKSDYSLSLSFGHPNYLKLWGENDSEILDRLNAFLNTYDAKYNLLGVLPYEFPGFYLRNNLIDICKCSNCSGDGDGSPAGVGPGLSITVDGKYRLGDHNTSLTDTKYFYITPDDFNNDFIFKSGFETLYGSTGDAVQEYSIDNNSITDSFYAYTNDYLVDYNRFYFAASEGNNLRASIFHNITSYKTGYTKEVTAAALLDAHTLDTPFGSSTTGWFNYTIEAPKHNVNDTGGFSLGLRAYTDTAFPQRGRITLDNNKNEIWLFVDPITQLALESTRYTGHTGIRFDWFNLTNTVDMFIADPIGQKGINYDGDYEANFEPRTLVTKQFVESLTPGAGSGLSIDGNGDIQLGKIFPLDESFRRNIDISEWSDPLSENTAILQVTYNQERTFLSLNDTDLVASSQLIASGLPNENAIVSLEASKEVGQDLRAYVAIQVPSQEHGINFSKFSDSSYIIDQIHEFGIKYSENYFTNGSLDDRWIPDWGAVKGYVTNTVPQTDGVTVKGTITQLVNDLTLNNAWEWRISNIDYSPAGNTTLSFPATTAGFHRIDLIVGNTLGVITRVAGTEVLTEEPVTAPLAPANTVPLAEVFVLETGLSSFTEFAIASFVRYDINNQGLSPVQRLNARINIQAVSKDTNDTRTGSLTNNGRITVNTGIGSSYYEGGLIYLRTGEDGTASSNMLDIANSLSGGGIKVQKRGSTIIRARGDSVTDYFILRLQNNNSTPTNVFQVNQNGATVVGILGTVSNQLLQVAGTGRFEGRVTHADAVLPDESVTLQQLNAAISASSPGVGAGITLDGSGNIRFGEYDSVNLGENIFNLNQYDTLYNQPASITWMGFTSPTANYLKYNINLISGNYGSNSYVYVEDYGTGVYAENFIGVNDAVGNIEIRLTASTISADTSAIVLDEINQRGLENAGDYEANFVARSLVTKQYVDNNYIGNITGSVPVANNSTGVKGTFAYDSDFIYICINTDSWIRSPRDLSF